MELERRGRQLIREINIVPFLDVLIVILFFYMVVSPMMSRGLDVHLPKSESSTTQPSERVVITVTRAQEVFIEKERVEVSRLKDILNTIRKGKPQINVYLRADRDVPYGAVVQVMDIVKRAGIDKLGMVTEPAPESESAK